MQTQMTNKKSVQNAQRVLAFEKAMYDKRSRYLIIALTLNYLPEYQKYINLDIIRQHRDQLLNNRRSNSLLREIDGYVWKIEKGDGNGGLHLHLIIFYSGAHRNDISIGRFIGEYWKNTITNGAGSYWNSNTQKEFHAQYGYGVGVGQIDRNDQAKRQALCQNLLYLTKDEQYAGDESNPHLRMFGTSQFLGV